MLRFLCACILITAGCQLDNPGIDPPAAQLNLPVSVALSTDPDPAGAPDFLFVANSNFDVRYNAGSVQSYRLADTIDALSECQAEAEGTDESPRDDCEVLPADVLESEVLIGSFASGLALSPSGRRLYVPVRSDADLTFIDVNEGSLSCGGDPGDRHECSDDFTRSNRLDDADEDLHLPGEPIAISVGALGADFDAPERTEDYVFLAHRNGGASLFTATAGSTEPPVLVDVLEGLTDDLAALGRDPSAQLFWLSSDRSAVISRVGVALGTGVPPTLYDAGVLTMVGVDFGQLGADTRSVVFDPRGVRRAYVLMRRPEAIVVADLDDDAATTVAVNRIIQVGSGPSRLGAATFLEGTRLLLFVSCFDSRDLYVIDPDVGELLAVVRGMSGPFELAVDVVREAVYVTDFRSSVIRVITLAPLLHCLRNEEGCGAPTILGSIGSPRLVEELR